jgi:hypothetical protein
MMADSRGTDDSGGNFTYKDDAVKIRPYENFIVGSAGLGKTLIMESDTKGKLFKNEQLLEHFFKINNKDLPRMDGRIIIEGLVDTWNNTFESLNVHPKEYRASFMLSKWEGLEPRIYICHTLNRLTNIDSLGGVIGADDAQAIVAASYMKTREELRQMQFEETIDHFKQAFAEVSKEVKTVGGPVNIFILGQRPSESRWWPLNHNG